MSAGLGPVMLGADVAHLVPKLGYQAVSTRMRLSERFRKAQRAFVPGDLPLPVVRVAPHLPGAVPAQRAAMLKAAVNEDAHPPPG